MRWRIGWLFNTLNYQIDKNLSETVYASESFQRHGWSFLERQILKISKHPLKYAAFIPLSGILLIASASLLKQYYYPHIQSLLYNLRWIFSWQEVFLGAQLTLIGVVFPLVIGLVGFLLQNKTASKAIWSVYNHYSAFLFSGFSGLMLILFIIVGRYAESIYSDYPYIGHCLLSNAWFIGNIFFCGWFLLATFKIIQESERDNLIVRYTLNESFIGSIRKRLSYLLPQAAFDHGILSLPAEAKFEVSTIRFSSSADFPFKSHLFKSDRYVSAIRFRFLQWAISTKIALQEPSGDLVLPLTVDNYGKRQFVIADFSSSEGGKITRLLLRLAYGFSRKRPYEKDQLDEIIFAIVGNVHDEFSNDVRRFDIALKKLTDWHCEIADSLSFVNDDQKVDNWLQLASSPMWGRSYLDELLYEYYQIVKKCVTRIPYAPEYFNLILHLFPRLHNFSKNQLPEQYVDKLIQSQYLCWYSIVNWYKDIQGGTQSSAAENYRACLMEYVSNWESWLMYLEARSKRWSKSTYKLRFFVTHLKYTAQGIIASVNCEDEISSHWAVDMLLYWHDNATTRSHGVSRYLWRTPILVHSLFGSSRDGALWRYILNGNEYDDVTAAEVSLEHVWQDVRISVAAYLNSSSSGDDLKSDLVDALISGRRFSAGLDSAGNSQALDQPQEIFQSYLRQIWFSEYEENSYGAWLSYLIDAFNRIDEPKRISGRVYSIVGARNVHSLRMSFIFFVARASHSIWNVSQAWIDLLLSDISSVQRRGDIQREISSWIEILTKDANNFTGLSDHQKDNCVESLKSLYENLKGHNVKLIADADIDHDRLLEFAKSASRDAFKADAGGFLVSLFSEIKESLTEQSDKECSLSVNEYDKANVAKGIDVARSVNELDWMSENIKRSVDQNLTREVVFGKQHTESYFADANELVDRLVNDISQLPKGDWLILVGCWPVQRLLDEQLYATGGRKFDIKYLKGFGESYILHLNRVPVYQINRTSPSTVLLVERAAFSKLEVRRYPNGQLVDVRFTDINTETLKGKLKFRYQLRAEFNQNVKTYRYNFVDSQSDDE